MATTTWNPADKSGSITLSNGNLTATNIGAVRSVDSQVSGKFYWEVTGNTWASNGSSIGVTRGNSTLGTIPSSAGAGSGICGVAKNGNIYIEGAGGGSLGAIVSGNVVCIALDYTNRLIWFRVGASGNWNGSGTANPATGVGGDAIPFGAGVAGYPTVWPVNTNEQATANFGASAFTGAVPAGFNGSFGPMVAAQQAIAMVLA